jgi:hypothetical protein
MMLRLLLRPSIDNETEAKISRLVATVEDGWHDWAHPDPCDPALENYFQHNPTHRELLEKSFMTATAYGSGRRLLTIIDDAGQASEGTRHEADSLSLSQAIHYLAQQLQVLVENERNDGRFYVEHLSAVNPALTSLFDGPCPPVVFAHGGGKDEMIELLRHRITRSHNNGIIPRLFVLVDSDAGHPGHENRKTRAIRQFCDSHGIPLIVLMKRAIENYLDDDILREYAATYRDVLDSVDFICSLRADQRDHYPMKVGLPSCDGRATVTNQDQARLFEGVEFPLDWTPKLPRVVSFYMDTLPPRRDENLSSRGCRDEFAEIARRIRWEI